MSTDCPHYRELGGAVDECWMCETHQVFIVLIIMLINAIYLVIFMHSFFFWNVIAIKTYCKIWVAQGHTQKQRMKISQQQERHFWNQWQKYVKGHIKLFLIKIED